MSFSLISNLGSLESQSKLNVTGAKLNQAIQRLSSGLRINMSGDDAAGLSIANKYRSDIGVISQGVRNANDGLSTLQTIDGGLANISTLLDRASVLSAQSASDTFSGNRDTLQGELSKVMSEVTRQAQAIGMVSAGVNNKALTTIIGGGSDTFSANNTNNGVQIDLSGASNRVDALSLGVGALNIGTGTGNVQGFNAITTLSQAETLTFQSVGSSGALSSFTVALSNGSSGSAVADAINNDTNAKAAGVTASIDSAAKLVLTSAKLFTVASSIATATSGSTGIVGTGAAINDVAISGVANKSVVNITGAAGTPAVQTLSFTGSEIGYTGNAHDTTFTAGVSAAQGVTAALAAVNNDLALRAQGVFAIASKADSSAVTFVSAKNFNLAVTSASVTAADNNIDTMQSATAASGASVTGGSTGAKAALDAIKAAVVALGSVQGTVGAGENRLQQAVDLATSQITNFQAAESRIRDADVAQEASSMSRLTVLQQAGVAALAQANQSSQAVLSLLR